MQCFCGFEYAGLSKMDESRCNMACSGNNNQACGSIMILSVYTYKRLNRTTKGPQQTTSKFIILKYF